MAAAPIVVADPETALAAPFQESVPDKQVAGRVAVARFVKTGSVQQAIDLGNGLSYQFTQKVDQNGDSHSAVEEDIFDKKIASALRNLRGRYGVFDITPTP